MAGLQRSETSFRRQGSSGLVWDDKLFSGELKQVKPKDEEDRAKAEPNREHTHRAVKVEPTLEPSSPRVSGCGFCGMLGKPVAAKKTKIR